MLLLHIVLLAAGAAGLFVLFFVPSIIPGLAKRAAFGFVVVGVLGLVRLLFSGFDPPKISLLLLLLLWSAGFGLSGLIYRGEDRSLIRGAGIESAFEKMKRLLKQKLGYIKSRFSFGDVAVPVEMETRNFLLVGSPGSGKSQALTAALDAIEPHSQCSVIVDPSGIFTSRYFSEERGDIILNPFDRRTHSWSPLAEIRATTDCIRIAKAIIPDGYGESEEWNGYAQSFLSNALALAYRNDLTNGDLFYIISVASLEELRPLFAGTSTAPQVAEGNERMFGSIRTILAKYTAFMAYLKQDVGKDGFSVRNHIEKMNSGWVFIPFAQSQRDALKPFIGGVVDIASRAVLELAPDLNRRVMFALDEFPLIGKVQSIVELLTNGRKHGAMVFIGIQTIAQLRVLYGRDLAQTIMACLGNSLVLRCSDHETAQEMVRQLGDQEFARNNFSENISSKSHAFSGSASKQIQISSVLLSSELQRLKDLNGYLALADGGALKKVNLHISPERVRSQGLDIIEESHNKITFSASDALLKLLNPSETQRPEREPEHEPGDSGKAEKTIVFDDLGI